MEVAWQVEIDPQCRAVLEYHWPGAPRFADITETPTDALAPVDLIAGGSPCQDLSVAGTRTGLDGERSGLFYEFCRIADSQPSAWILWENVDGALSTHGGMDFSIILRELCGYWFEPRPEGWRNSGFCLGPKRWLVWRVLDSEYFGVAQRRYRVFVVGGPRDGACRPEVLLEPNCLPGHPPPSREAGTGVTPILEVGARTNGGVGCGDGIGRPGDPMFTLQATKQHGVGPVEIVSALTRCGVGASGEDDNQAQGGHLVVGALSSSFGEWSYGADSAAAGYYVAHTLRGEGFDASEDGTGRGTPLVVARCLSTRGGQRQDFFDWQKGNDLTNIRPSTMNLQEEVSPTLSGTRVPAAFQCHGSNVGPMGTLRAGNGNETGGVPFVGVDLRNGSLGTVAMTLQGGGMGQDRGLCPNAIPHALPGHGVRRLTPRECERLQGYPDDWTRYGINSKGKRYELKDSPRYRMVGNGVTRTTGAWIGRRIAKALQPDAPEGAREETVR